MKRWIALLFLVSVLWRSGNALAQTVHYPTPPGGLTIKRLVVTTDGWAFIEFEEVYPERIHCGHVYAGAATYTYVAWINLTTASGKQVYGLAAAAFILGKKVEGLNLGAMGTWCELHVLRMAQ